MTSVLAAALAINAILHWVIVARFGVKGNEPPLIFGIVYAALTIAVALAVPYALWATLILSIVGIVGLTVAFTRIPHDKTVERVIWVLDAAIILFVVYLLFIHQGSA
jgi:hypothetical protein